MTAKSYDMQVTLYTIW